MVEIPTVCATVAAGLGTLGVVIFWLRDVTEATARHSRAAYLETASFGITLIFDSENVVSPLNYDLPDPIPTQSTQTAISLPERHAVETRLSGLQFGSRPVR